MDSRDAQNEPVEDMFSGMKKKKAKKVVILVEPQVIDSIPSAESTLPLAAAEEGAEDFSDLKKKKKKKVIIEDDVDEEGMSITRTIDALGNETITKTLATPKIQTEESIATESSEFDEFADLKKKKKKGGKKATFDLEAFEKELASQDATPDTESTPVGSDGEDGPEPVEGLDDVPEGEDPFKNNGGIEEEGTMSKAEAAADAKAWLKEDRDYTYTELLGRFYGLLYASHPSLSSSGLKKRYTLAPPSMHREGNKRSVFANVAEICKKMHRQPEHVIMFLFAELGTSGSVDGSGRLVIKGRFQQKQIENVLRRYIMEYVTCKTCKSPDTLLTKDNRLFFMACESCGSTRSVSAIKSGFQAQTGKRRAMRAAA